MACAYAETGQSKKLIHQSECKLLECSASPHACTVQPCMIDSTMAVRCVQQEGVNLLLDGSPRVHGGPLNSTCRLRPEEVKINWAGRCADDPARASKALRPIGR